MQTPKSRAIDKITEEAVSGSVRQQREVSVVRRFLEFLPDSNGNAKSGKRSIDHYASELNIDADRLRSFRDGNSTALGHDAIALFATLLGRNTDGMPGVEMDDAIGFADPSANGWYGAMVSLEMQRVAKMRSFSLIDRSRSEAHSALNCYADLGVTGNVGETSRYGGGFEPVVFDGSIATKDAFAKDSANINQNLFPDDQKWSAFRGVAKYGNQYGEIGLGKKGGRLVIDRFRPLHARTMQVNIADDGSYDPSYAFKQVLPGRVDPIAKFPAWQIAHMKNTIGWGDLYGESIFECGLRAWMQVESMEAAMIVRRLERASQKLKHIIDVGMVDGGDDSINKKIADYRAVNTKLKTVDTAKNMRNQRISLPSGEDVIIAKRDASSPADVAVLAGDQYIEQIGDFVHFFNKWLSGLGPPKAHLGYEGDDSKTGVNDKHIVFARKVRAMQLKFIGGGLNHLHWVSMILRGVDPRTVKYVIFPPSLGTRDELIAAQVQLAHATTVQYLAKAFGQTGKQPSIAWFLKYVMGYDDEVVDSLNLPGMISKVKVPPGGGGAGFKNDPPANAKDNAQREKMAAIALTNPFLLEHIDAVQFLVEENMIARRDARIIPKLWREQQRLTKPFNIDGRSHFESTVRSLGISELRRAS